MGISLRAAVLTELADQAHLSEAERSASEAAIVRSIGYFRRLWQEAGWQFGKVSAEENSVLILIEIAPALRRYDQEFLAEVLNTINGWITPFGKLSEHYSSRLSHRSRLSQYSRMAYALRMSGASADVWTPLYRYATEVLAGKTTSADMAFLLDLVCDDFARLSPVRSASAQLAPRTAAQS